jgi:hypothetical protein
MRDTAHTTSLPARHPALEGKLNHGERVRDGKICGEGCEKRGIFFGERAKPVRGMGSDAREMASLILPPAKRR